MTVNTFVPWRRVSAGGIAASREPFDGKRLIYGGFEVLVNQ
jgi:uncharacterized protein YbaA (DUF1428 family)